jgi:hypothetical protein
MREGYHDHRPCDRGGDSAAVGEPQPAKGGIPSLLRFSHLMSVRPERKNNVIVRLDNS